MNGKEKALIYKMEKLNSTLEEVTTEKVNNCPICLSSLIKEWCEGYDRLYQVNKQRFTFSRCQSCDLIFLSKRPIREKIYKFYPENYGPYFILGQADENRNSGQLNQNNGNNLVFYKVLRKFNALFTSIIDDNTSSTIQKYYIPRSEKSALLDFGCGSDAFLNHARNQGFETIGMDFSEQAVAQVGKSKHQAILYDSESSWDKIQDNSLDFIRMNHVLEHLYNPIEVLENMKTKLKKGGIIHIAIPNPRGIAASFYKENWFSLDAPRHIMLYSPKALSFLLKKVGFSSFEILHEFLTKDFARSIGFNNYEKGKISHQEAITSLERTDLKELLYIPCLLAQKFGKADRIHAIITIE